MKRLSRIFLPFFLLCCVLLSSCTGEVSDTQASFSLDNIPPFADSAYVVINENVPEFAQDDLTEQAFETYSDLDSLGRCGPAYANICQELMPTEERGEIGSVKPSGWQTVKYDHVDGKYLYNRCHLIGFQLAGENANEKNLITGTRYMNVEGMLPFENLVADYVKETDNHVLYRVTPVFEGNNLVASGVHMEALSVEDDGEGVCFNVYVYNNQPGVSIDYATGESWLSSNPQQTAESEASGDTYILNTSSHKFHEPSCPGVTSMNEENKEIYTGDRESLIAQGYSPCGQCNP
jgi:DNA-entry nuclease